MAAQPVRLLLLGGTCILALCGIVGGNCPTITSVTLTPEDPHSGDQVTAVIRTSDDATAVVAHVHDHDIPVPQVTTGMFSGTAVIPHIPRFIHLHVPVTFTVSDDTGAQSSRTISVKIN